MAVDNGKPYKAKVYLFDDDGLVDEEHIVFDNLDEMNSYADRRAISERENGRRIKVVWTQSLVCSGSIGYI